LYSDSGTGTIYSAHKEHFQMALVLGWSLQVVFER